MFKLHMMCRDNNRPVFTVRKLSLISSGYIIYLSLTNYGIVVNGVVLYFDTEILTFRRNLLQMFSGWQKSSNPRRCQEYSPHERSAIESTYLSLYGCTALLDLGHFFSSLILYIAGRTPSTGHQFVAWCYLHTEKHKHRINAHRHPCLEWASNPRSQCSRGRRRFMS
jgi:hypothetical protein